MAPERDDDYEWSDVMAESIRIWATPERATTWNDVLNEAAVSIAVWRVAEETDDDMITGLYFSPCIADIRASTWWGRDPSEAIREITHVLGAQRARGDESMIPTAPNDDPRARLCGMGVLLREKHYGTDLESDSIYLTDDSPQMYVARFCGTDMMIVDSAPAPDPSEDMLAHCADRKSIYRPVHLALHNLLLTCHMDVEKCAEQYGGANGEKTLADYAARCAQAEELANPLALKYRLN